MFQVLTLLTESEKKLITKLYNFLHIGSYNKMTLSFTGIRNHHCSSTLSSENNSSNGWAMNSSLFTLKIQPTPLTFLNADLQLSAKIFTADKTHINRISTTKLIILQQPLSCPIMDNIFTLQLFCSKNSPMKSLFTTLEKETCSQSQSLWEKTGKERFNQLSFWDIIWLSFLDI